MQRIQKKKKKRNVTLLKLWHFAKGGKARQLHFFFFFFFNHGHIHVAIWQDARSSTAVLQHVLLVVAVTKNEVSRPTDNQGVITSIKVWYYRHKWDASSEVWRHGPTSSFIHFNFFWIWILPVWQRLPKWSRWWTFRQVGKHISWYFCS